MAADELELSCALTVNERTAPLLDGTIKPAGIRLVAGPLGAGDMFWRQLEVRRVRRLGDVPLRSR